MAANPAMHFTACCWRKGHALPYVRYGTITSHESDAMLAVVKFREAAARQPEALRRMVTAHVRNRAGTLPDYLAALHTISAIVVAVQEPGAAGAGAAVAEPA